MELDRLTIDEIQAVASILALLGTMASIEDAGRAIRICDAACGCYQRVLRALQEAGHNG